MNDNDWKPIKDFETYAINKNGEIKDLRSKKLVKQFPNIKAGNYLQVNLVNENGYTQRRVHRLVLETFVPRSSYSDVEADHIDRNRQNNKLNNLRWVSKIENLENRIAWGKYCKHIILEDTKTKKNPNPSWRISIKNSKLKYSKRFQYSEYTLEQVKAIRDKLYEEHGIIKID